MLSIRTHATWCNSIIVFLQLYSKPNHQLGTSRLNFGVNNFRNFLDFSTNVLFADDTGKNIRAVDSKTNLELKNINKWMTANKLMVNSAKTKYLLFTPRKSNYSVANKSFQVQYRNSSQLLKKFYQFAFWV